jgi:uncharacterized protein YjiK
MIIEQSEFEEMSRKEKIEYALDNSFRISRERNQLDYKFYYVIHAYDKTYTASVESVK